MEKLSYRGAHTSHGGVIQAGTPHNVYVMVNGDLVSASLDGDPHPCPKCDTVSNVIATGFVNFEGIKHTRVGDQTTCGATVIDGCDNTFSD